MNLRVSPGVTHFVRNGHGDQHRRQLGGGTRRFPAHAAGRQRGADRPGGAQGVRSPPSGTSRSRAWRRSSRTRSRRGSASWPPSAAAACRSGIRVRRRAARRSSAAITASRPRRCGCGGRWNGRRSQGGADARGSGMADAGVLAAICGGAGIAGVVAGRLRPDTAVAGARRLFLVGIVAGAGTRRSIRGRI